MAKNQKLDSVEESRIVAQAKEQKEIELGLNLTFGEAKADTPVVHALAVQRIGNHYACVEYTIQGDKVLSVVADEPNIRAVAIDCFKIAAAKHFLD